MLTSRGKFRSCFYPRGFTLVEMILVTALTAVIGAALYRALADGITIWQRTQRSGTDEEVLLFLDRFKQDLHNAVIYSQIDFELGADSFAFPSVIRIREDKVKTSGRILYADQIGKVEYFFDKRHRRICRRQANYSQALKGRYGSPQDLVSSVQSVRFDYAYAREIGPDAPQGEEGFMPAAILVEMDIIEDKGRLRSVRRLINIPVATIL